MYGKPITRKWWSAYAQLHGKAQVRPNGQINVEGQLELSELPPHVSEVKKKAIPSCPTEQDEHFVAAAWLRKNNIPHHHSPNGGYRDYREAAKFKRLGTSPGFPDIWIPLARKGYHGLYIELKRVSGGVLSEHQKYWRDLSLREGYAWHEAKGASQFIEIVKNYLGV